MATTSKPGPQPCNQIAGTADEQIARAVEKPTEEISRLRNNAAAACRILNDALLVGNVNIQDQLIAAAIRMLEGES